MTVVFLIIAAVYICFTITLLYFWFEIIPFSPKIIVDEKLLKLSVVIPVRNEEVNIIDLLRDLEAQTYPIQLFEILVIDDASTDNTANLVSNYASNSIYNIKLISLDAIANISSKKQAITLAISQAIGDWIVATDGDCRVGTKWLETIVNFQLHTQARFIFGGVSFYNERSVFEHLQTVEFAALTGSGAASLQGQFPNMCNGANLAYEKKIFELVNGFQGNSHIPSGDDEFLMHKIFSRNPSDVKFLKSKEATVYTSAKTNWKDFFNQRKRWAGKWPHYQLPYIKWIATLILVGNVNFIVWLLACVLLGSNWKLFVICFVVKSFADAMFIKQILFWYDKKFIWKYFIISAILYPFYVSFFALNSKSVKYEWKGRNL